MVLCQPDAAKSCGACCGLYNYADSSRPALVRRLRKRTKRFWETMAAGGRPEAFAERILREEDFSKRYEVIYCCEYLGFLDREEKRVGCLLHPAVHGGEDLRGISFYGRELCAGHLCPSHQHLTEKQKRILIRVLDDWYLYGLCLTDIDLVKTYFQLLSDRVGEEVRPERMEEEGLRATVQAFFSWKVSWPFRSEETGRLGKYFFDGSEYMIARIDYERLGRRTSPFHPLFLSFTSEFRSGEELDQGEAMIRANLDRFTRFYLEKKPLALERPCPY